MRISKSAALAAALFFFAACGGYVGCDYSTASGPLRIELNRSGERAAIDVAGRSGEQAVAVGRIGSRARWSEVFRVAVAPDQPPMLGEYTLAGDRARFTPMFPLDPGRQYHVTFAPAGARPITATVGLPATHTTPTTMVAQV